MTDKSYPRLIDYFMEYLQVSVDKEDFSWTIFLTAYDYAFLGQTH